jgi:hypothetical protein
VVTAIGSWSLREQPEGIALSEAVADSDDPYGAFGAGSTRRIEGAIGPLARTTSAVKDNIDVAGRHRSGRPGVARGAPTCGRERLGGL